MLYLIKERQNQCDGFWSGAGVLRKAGGEGNGWESKALSAGNFISLDSTATVLVKSMINDNKKPSQGVIPNGKYIDIRDKSH